jgi:hypothetical protein
VSTSQDSGRSSERDIWPAGETFMFHYAGKWMTAEQMRAAQVDRLLPRQPKREWRRK